MRLSGCLLLVVILALPACLDPGRGRAGSRVNSEAGEGTRSGGEEGEGEGDTRPGEGEGEGQGEGEGEGEGPGEEPCETAELDGVPGIEGLLYWDRDASNMSVHLAGYDESVDEPLAGARVRLLGPNGEQTVSSCRDGTFAFGPLEDGIYHVAPEQPEGTRCTRKNCAPSTAKALSKGEITVVTFGDSIPTEGDNTRFPSRLADLLGDLAEIDNRNVAVGGSTSPDWLPGTRNFEQQLGPHIEDADVIIVSLGGNDVTRYASNPAVLAGGVEGAIEGAYDVVEQVVANIQEILLAVRERNPSVDFVYCLYVDYSKAEQDRFWSLIRGVLGEDSVRDIHNRARTAIPDDQGIILVDVFGATEDLVVDDLLADTLHLNGAGHTLYAEEIFEVLGGVLVGESPIPTYGSSPLGLEKIFSFAE